MDPNANLEEQLRLARQILKDFDTFNKDPDPNAQSRRVGTSRVVVRQGNLHIERQFNPSDAIRLCELVIALDEWLKSGGFFPRTWSGATSLRK